MTPRYQGKTVLVTGAARSLGRSIALAFANEGADVAVNDICSNLTTVGYPLSTVTELEAVSNDIRRLGVKSLAIKADVSEASQVKAMIHHVVRELKKLDILVNNAGITTMSEVINMPEAMWDQTIAVNLKSVFLCCKYAARQMIRSKYGRIVNISSVYGLVGAEASSHYCASKHGVIGFTKSLARELARFGVTVNAVCPTLLDTEMSRRIIELYLKKKPEEVMGRIEVHTLFPDHPVMTAEEVADAVLWLASDSARHITGLALPIDGGFLTQ
jgi:NAD(P)-dependent dehydrogenase (short-subunit alcohol dehydrogenase family)